MAFVNPEFSPARYCLNRYWMEDIRGPFFDRKNVLRQEDPGSKFILMPLIGSINDSLGGYAHLP